MVQDMIEYKETTQLQSKIHKLGKKLKSKINAMHEPKQGDDPVLDAYENLTKICTFVKTEDELIVRAKTRKILGSPPISPDRYSVCDELLLEELLDFCNEDLIIVSNDRALTENKKIIRDEFASIDTGKILTVVKSVSEELKILGEVPDRLEAAEAEMNSNIKRKLSKTANAIMEAAIGKSSPVILNEDNKSLVLTIKNATFG